MSFLKWLEEMVGQEVVVETEDDEFVGTLNMVTAEPSVCLRLEDVINRQDREFGTTLIPWGSLYRVSLTTENSDIEDEDEDEDIDDEEVDDEDE